MDYDAAVRCMAENLYYEAANQSLPGILAVGHVTLNRARAARLDVCAVVHAPSQFSWTLQRERANPDPVAFAGMLDLARGLLRSPGPDPTHGATYYHATYVSPAWARGMRRTTKIGAHVFYIGPWPWRAAEVREVAAPARAAAVREPVATEGESRSRAERSLSWPPMRARR